MTPRHFTLLLGAGFTKNFGGLVASEMWAKIFGHKGVQSHPRVKAKMFFERDYEKLYHDIVIKDGTEYRREEKDGFSDAVIAAYDHLDRISQERLHNHAIDLHRVRGDFLNRFQGRNRENGFIFTLNQDLFVERQFNTCPEFRLPGLELGRTGNRRSLVRDRYFFPLRKEDYFTLPTQKQINGLNKEGELTSFNLVKLHGSYNFLSSHRDGTRRMVIGRRKEGRISEEPLLAWYFHLFEQAMRRGDVRLLVCGYGFGDEHINRVLEEGAGKHGLRIYVMDPLDPAKLIDRLSDKFPKLAESMSGFFPYRLVDLFPRGGAENNPQWEDVLETFFDERHTCPGKFKK